MTDDVGAIGPDSNAGGSDPVIDSNAGESDPVADTCGEDGAGAPTPDGDADDLDRAVKREFVVQVLLLNAALLFVALGAMLLVFRADLDAGIGLFAIGLVAGLATLRRYRAEAPSS